VNIKAAHARNLEHLIAQELREGEDNNEIKILLTEFFLEVFFLVDVLSLKERKIILLGELNHLWRLEIHPATRGAIRHRDDVTEINVRMLTQKFQCRHGEVGSSAKGDPEFLHRPAVSLAIFFL
jgi:hypothetical protein